MFLNFFSMCESWCLYLTKIYCYTRMKTRGVAPKKNYLRDELTDNIIVNRRKSLIQQATDIILEVYGPLVRMIPYSYVRTYGRHDTVELSTWRPSLSFVGTKRAWGAARTTTMVPEMPPETAQTATR